GFTVAMLPGPSGAYGTGGLILWPLFGATNQLLAGLALMVTFFYLWRRGKKVAFVAIPMCLMLLMPAWAML
ncbi:MAG TPA: carbon starvation protein A, partial [Planctomycetaceae bacterium]|nr:carbon starvation protein A [Planctomycetaceae bacterium]